MNRALDPQAAVLIGWIGARFVPDFRFLKKSMKKIIKKNHLFLGFDHKNPGFLYRASDPQNMVWIRWSYASFMPIFRFILISFFRILEFVWRRGFFFPGLCEKNDFFQWIFDFLVKNEILGIFFGQNP